MSLPRRYFIVLKRDGQSLEMREVDAREWASVHQPTPEKSKYRGNPLYRGCTLNEAWHPSWGDFTFEITIFSPLEQRGEYRLNTAQLIELCETLERLGIDG